MNDRGLDTVSRRAIAPAADDPYRPKAAKRIESALSHAVDAGLVGIVFLVPFAMGGRQALGQLLLVGLAFWLGACWCLKQAFRRQGSWTHSIVEPILLAAVLLGCLQIAQFDLGQADGIGGVGGEAGIR